MEPRGHLHGGYADDSMRPLHARSGDLLPVLLALLGCHVGRDPAPAPAAAATPAASAEKSAAGCAFQDERQFCACLGLTCGGDTVADRDGTYHTVYCGTCDASRVCIGKPSVAGGAAGVCSAIPGLTPAQKKVAEQLTSLWENDTTNLAYSYSENIEDGRGFTSGRAGFCTGTGDAIVVIACYQSMKPGNRMQKYLPALGTLEQSFIRSSGKENQGGTQGLEGWVADWKASGSDPAFQGCQDTVVDAVYYGSAMQHAARRGFTTALTKAAFYDAQINMGDENPVYGMRAIIARADQLTGPLATPPTRDQEQRWLANFLRVRAELMYGDAKNWRTNMYRVALYEKLRRSGNLDLAGCIKTGVSAAAMWPGAGFPKDTGPIATVGACPKKLAKL
jgi:chitosanase